MKRNVFFFLLAGAALLTSCHSKIKERKDELYSRHLQKHISITVITTPVPKNKSDFNLLLLNNGNDIENLHVKKVVDSLYRKDQIKPLIVVGIIPFNESSEYGVSGKIDEQGNGASAEKYSQFIAGELIPFVKKKAAVRKFNSITIGGTDLSGLSALDVAWDNADKIDKVGVFSGAFSTEEKLTKKSDSTSERRMIFNKIKSSRKRPHLQYWFYVAANNSSSNNSEPINETRELINLVKSKNVAADSDFTFVENKNGSNDFDSWSHVFPQFLLWAEGK
ncbi:MAG TPA: alpha/beta hydrolase-fold protein [Hanamia sp.]|nr:alpha/beta hydrolase-fold protein [Hanamia sp.]